MTRPSTGKDVILTKENKLPNYSEFQDELVRTMAELPLKFNFLSVSRNGNLVIPGYLRKSELESCSGTIIPWMFITPTECRE